MRVSFVSCASLALSGIPALRIRSCTLHLCSRIPLDLIKTTSTNGPKLLVRPLVPGAQVNLLTAGLSSLQGHQGGDLAL